MGESSTNGAPPGTEGMPGVMGGRREEWEGGRGGCGFRYTPLACTGPCTAVHPVYRVHAGEGASARGGGLIHSAS